MESGGGAWSAATIAKIAACAVAAGYVAHRRKSRSRLEHSGTGEGTREDEDASSPDVAEVDKSAGSPKRRDSLKTVPVCLREPGPAAKLRRASVDLDLTAITCWGDPLIAALAAGVGVDPAKVASVWLREDDDEEPDRLDDKPKGGWKRVLKMDETVAVLMLDVGTAATGPPQTPAPSAAAAKPAAATLVACVAAPPPAPIVLRGLGDDDLVEYSPEYQQNYERLARLLLTDPHNYTMLRAVQEVRPSTSQSLERP